MSRKFSLRRAVVAATIALAATFSVGAAVAVSDTAPDVAEEEAFVGSWQRGGPIQTYGGTWS